MKNKQKEWLPATKPLIFNLGDGLTCTPAATLVSPAAALGKICADTFLLLDFTGLNQGRGAGQDSNPGLSYSNPHTNHIATPPEKIVLAFYVYPGTLHSIAFLRTLR
jgi:hypothetical protein